MPDNLINQLNQQKNLATHQARLLLSPELHKFFDWAIYSKLLLFRASHLY